MIRYILAIILLTLATSQECSAGYSVHTDSMRPEFTTVNGPDGPQLWRSSLEAPPAPPTMGAELCRPANYSPFAADSARRTRVFNDNYGIATLADILAACPDLKKGLLDKARQDVSAALAKTDYMVIKEVEVDGYVMPAEVKASRQAWRDRFNIYESAINAADTIEKLLATPWGN